MRKLLLMTGLCGALAACGGQPSVSITNASPEEVAAKAKAAGLVSQIRPGEWETSVELLALDMPGMDPMLKNEMMKQARKTRVHSYCVTEEQAKKPGGIFGDDNQGKCNYDKFEMSGGKVDIRMTCPGRGGAMKMHLAGTFTADAVTAINEMTGDGQFPMHMKANVASKRIGECKGGAAKGK